jgi:hypothetical protein
MITCAILSALKAKATRCYGPAFPDTARNENVEVSENKKKIDFEISALLRSVLIVPYLLLKPRKVVMPSMGGI